ncbi:MAG TPA: SDR family oxidoreductase [Patescibacteria group bacterium]|nr:SDR family oxidoreductase [Patescibacteria group bacterium]
MKNKVVIIGGTSGIGYAAAQKFHHENFAVVIAGRDPEKLKSALQNFSHDTSGFAVDAASPAAIKNLYDSIGPFDHLILSLSGAKGAGPFATLDLDDLRQGFAAKYWVQVLAAQMALPYLHAEGSITFVTAVSARMANPGTAGLAAINGALECMVPTLALELAPLRINAVSPGVVDTPWWNCLPSEQRQATFEQYSQTAPLRKIGQPENLAEAIYALATNSFITGQILAVDGGLRLRSGA